MVDHRVKLGVEGIRKHLLLEADQVRQLSEIRDHFRLSDASAAIRRSIVETHKRLSLSSEADPNGRSLTVETNALCSIEPSLFTYNLLKRHSETQNLFVALRDFPRWMLNHNNVNRVRERAEAKLHSYFFAALSSPEDVAAVKATVREIVAGLPGPEALSKFRKYLKVEYLADKLALGFHRDSVVALLDHQLVIGDMGPFAFPYGYVFREIEPRTGICMVKVYREMFAMMPTWLAKKGLTPRDALAELYPISADSDT